MIEEKTEYYIHKTIDYIIESFVVYYKDDILNNSNSYFDTLFKDVQQYLLNKIINIDNTYLYFMEEYIRQHKKLIDDSGVKDLHRCICMYRYYFICKEIIYELNLHYTSEIKNKLYEKIFRD